MTPLVLDEFASFARQDEATLVRRPVVRANESATSELSGGVIRNTPRDRGWYLTQRVLAALLLVASSPLFLLLWPLVCGTSRGPFLYSQLRPGLHGRPFRVWKIRSMRDGADRDRSLALGVTRNCAQVTRIGKLLRETKLDELPQLWNVVRGEMAFVGPRPIAFELHERLSRSIPAFASRLDQRPGLTSLSQVTILENGHGDAIESDWARRFEADRHRASHAGMRYDLVIIALTVLYLARRATSAVRRFIRRWSRVSVNPLAFFVMVVATGCAQRLDTDRFTDENGVLVRDLDTMTAERRDGVVDSIDVDVTRPVFEPPPEGYQVGAGDVLRLDVNGEPGMTDLRVPVDDSGRLQAPFIEPLEVRGKTTLEIQADLERLYAEYFHSPWVVVQVAEHLSQPIYLLGAFERPGIYHLERRTELLQAIAMGSGLNDRAWMRGARLIRGDCVLSIDLWKLFREGCLEENVFVHAGDKIYVPDRSDLRVYVFGNVAEPGEIMIEGNGIDLLRALSIADGPIEPDAALDEVRVVRSFSSTRSRMLVVDATKMLAGEVPPFTLEPGDVVYVPQSKAEDWNDVIRTLRPTVDLLNLATRPLSLFGVGEESSSSSGSKSKTSSSTNSKSKDSKKP